MAVGARIILGPQGQAAMPIALKARIVAVQRSGWEHEAREGEFGVLSPIRRHFEEFVFDARILMKRALERERRAREGEPDCASSECLPHAHQAILTRE